MFDLNAVQLVTDESCDAFVGRRVAAQFACGCITIWWADWTRGWRAKCRDHA